MLRFQNNRSTMCGMWHKVNLSSRIQLFWFQIFPSPRLVALTKIKNLFCPTIFFNTNIGPANFQTRVVPLFLPGGRGRNQSVSACFFLVIFNYCSHSPMTGWPIRMLSCDSPETLCFFFLVFLFISFPRN